MPGAISQTAYDGLSAYLRTAVPPGFFPNPSPPQHNYQTMTAYHLNQLQQAAQQQSQLQQRYPINMPVVYTSSVVGSQVNNNNNNNEAASKQHQASVNNHNSSSTLKLAEFASNMVYQMWNFKRHSSAFASQYGAPPASYPNISPTASPQFKNFCYNVLQQTQLSENVVFLSLKYVQKLVKNGTMSTGDKGSEYLVFTVALMLASKFLDDITFTNQTWSEVTNISVKELNSMEWKFLDILDCKLFVSDSEYKHWLQCLNEYMQRQHQQLLHQRKKIVHCRQPKTQIATTTSSKVIQSPHAQSHYGSVQAQQGLNIINGIGDFTYSSLGARRRQPKTQITTTTSSNVIQPPDAQSHYGSVQAQQGLNIVNGIGGFAYPSLESRNNYINNSNNLRISAKKEEGIAANTGGSFGSAPVMIAPPGFGIVGGFGAPIVSFQSSLRRTHPSFRAGMEYNNTSTRIGNIAAPGMTMLL